ncbi:hypothetical protein [Leptolyngbya sp. PCC 6406]|uniref:hypothetical protein n=1 Tax=Leptolyngbya sp. PCC 6406 TaxID=1173264 RepID=UPI0002ACCA43|nr:hypothetical protein [Leptolyngbya sp. PCC 6406]
MGQFWSHRWWSGAAGILGSAILLGTAPAWACRAGTPAAPSPDSREFSSDRYGLTLDIPANYRAMLRTGGSITFHDPVSFEFIQCLVRSGRYGRVPLHPVLETYTVPPNSTLSLVDLVRRRRPWVDYYNPQFEAVELAGQPALRYEYRHEIHRVQFLNVSFLTPDGQSLLTLSGPATDPVLTTAIATLRFWP